MSPAKSELPSAPLLVALTLLVLVYLWRDFGLLTQTPLGPGWDFMANCDASYAYAAGKNPYLPESYSLSRLLYTYPPVFLPFTNALCRGLRIDDLRHVNAYLPFLFATLALAVGAALILAKATAKSALFVFVFVSAYGGVFWILRTGNLSAFEVGCLTLSLACLLRSLRPGGPHVGAGYAFAALFGLFCGFKTVYCALIPLFFVLPAPATTKARWAALALALGLAPALLSLWFYPDFVAQQVVNVVADQARCNPSLLCLATHLHNRPPIDLAVMLWTVAMVAASMAALAFYALNAPLAAIWRGTGFADERQAFRVFVLLLMIAIGLFPRLKEYSYGLAAVGLAFAVIAQRDGERLGRAAILAAAAPLLALHPTLQAYSPLTFWAQLAALWTSIVVLLAAEYRPFLASVRPAAPALRSAA